MSSRCVILGFAAYSGTGKTTLLKQLIPIFNTRGINVGVIKHTHHDVELDQPGKDSYELRHAGAKQTLLAGPQRWSLVTETPQAREPELKELLHHLDQRHLDLILVEGFRDEAFPKIELHRTLLGKPFIFMKDKNIIALACDEPGAIKTTIPVLNINQPETIAEFIVQNFLPGT